MSVQLFVEPVIGLANNGDFGKITSPYHLAPLGQNWDNFLYVPGVWEYDPLFHWESGFFTTERLIPWLASRFWARFDFRLIAAIHLTIFLIFAGATVYALR